MRCTPVETENEQSLSIKVSLLNMENSWKILKKVKLFLGFKYKCYYIQINLFGQQ